MCKGTEAERRSSKHKIPAGHFTTRMPNGHEAARQSCPHRRHRAARVSGQGSAAPGTRRRSQGTGRPGRSHPEYCSRRGCASPAGTRCSGRMGGGDAGGGCQCPLSGSEAPGRRSQRGGEQSAAQPLGWLQHPLPPRPSRPAACAGTLGSRSTARRLLTCPGPPARAACPAPALVLFGGASVVPAVSGSRMPAFGTQQSAAGAIWMHLLSKMRQKSS